MALIKIDQSFVRDMLDNPDDRSILKGVIGLASAFHAEVIARGVETVDHGTMLLALRVVICTRLRYCPTHACRSATRLGCQLVPA